MDRVLLVDADPRTLNVLGVSLRQAGYDVTTAADGASAFAKIERALPRLLISATRLPKLDGYELVRRLKEIHPTAIIPIILLASEESVVDRARARELGVEEYLVKPIFVRELVARVQLLLARHAQDRVVDSAKHGRTGISGSTRDLAVVDLVQALEASGKSGTVRLQRGTEDALLYFSDGRVIDAELGPVDGEEAVYRTFGWNDASFEIEIKPITNKDVIVCSTQTILRRGMQRVQESIQPPEAPSSEEAITAETPTAPAPAAQVAAPPDGVAAPAVSLRSLANELPSPPAPRSQPPGDAPVPASASVRSSSAPWTTEIEPGDEAVPDDAEAAGVPRRGRTARRLAAMTVAIAAVVVAAGGLKMMRPAAPPHAQDTAQEAKAESITGAAAAAEPVKPPEAKPAEEVVGAAGAAAETVPSAPSAVEPAAGVQPLPGAGAVGPSDLAPAPPAVPVVGKESPIDVKLGGNQSPLVRDAEQALLKGDTDRALSLARQAVGENPADADAWLTLAAAQKASGDMASAGDTYRSCIKQAHTVGLNHCRILALQR